MSNDSNTPGQHASAAPRARLLRRIIAVALAAVAIAAPLAHAADDEQVPLNARFLAFARAADAAGMARTLKEGAAVNSRNRLGESALVIVLKQNRVDLATVLVAAGADVNLAAVNGITPLMAAAYGGQTEFVGVLLDKGADVTAVDRLQKNAMTYAAGEGHTAIVKVLLARGVDPNAVYRNDLTALMWAAGYGRVDTMRALLDAGAKPGLKDDRGKTALDIARDNKEAAAVGVLEAAAHAAPR